MDEKDSKRYRLICLLASGCSNKEASLQMEVSLSTIERMRQGLDFQSELTEAITKVYHSSLMQLTLGMNRAASELRKIIEAPDTPDRVRIKAIEVLFAQTSHLDSLTIEIRLSALESTLKARTIQEQSSFEDDGDWQFPKPVNQLESADCRFK